MPPQRTADEQRARSEQAVARRRRLVADVVHIVADHAARTTATVARLSTLSKAWAAGVGLSLAATCGKDQVLHSDTLAKARVRLHVSNEYAMSHVAVIDQCPGDERTLRCVCRGHRPELKHLEVEVPKDSGVAHIKELRQLQALHLHGALSDSGLANIVGLEHLLSLDLLSCWDLTDACLAHVAELWQLQWLNLGHCMRVTDEGISHIQGLRQLRFLDVSYSSVTDEGMAVIRHLRQLRFLYLSHCTKVTDAGIAQISGLPYLRSLKLCSCVGLTDDGLAHVAKLYQLWTLDLTWCGNITEAGMAHVAELRQLRTLILDLTTVATEMGLEHVAKMRQLRMLSVKGCVVSELDLEMVSFIPNLLKK